MHERDRLGRRAGGTFTRAGTFARPRRSSGRNKYASVWWPRRTLRQRFRDYIRSETKSFRSETCRSRPERYISGRLSPTRPETTLSCRNSRSESSISDRLLCGRLTVRRLNPPAGHRPEAYYAVYNISNNIID